jgi:hypothetical protein
MNPERVIEDQSRRTELRLAFGRFTYANQTAKSRQDVFDNAGVILPNVKFDDSAHPLAENLTSTLADRPISAREGERHPLLLLLDYILGRGIEQYGFQESDEDLFAAISKEANHRTLAVRARASVGKIETESKVGIGTGVLIGTNLLLTCAHVLSKTRVQQAWVRFGHKINWDGRTIAPGMHFSLDLKNRVAEGGGSEPDYVLLKIQNSSPRPAIPFVPMEVNANQPVWTIHHPQGKPAIVSAQGQITQVGTGYIHHTLQTEEGSSGAPIFDQQWNLIALHQGLTSTTSSGLVTGVPLEAFWDTIRQHIN